MAAYYNEIDKFAAAWIRELIKAGHIAEGDVDERSIEDVQPEDLRGYTQCHFFAGIGVWSYALRRAGWADDVRVWTGSCPCQSFSASGKRAGFSDKRHLWPAWFRLISECRPDVCFGEQVASKDGLAWLDIVSSDLEAEGYTFGAADMCAAGVGAPHIRQRVYFLADSQSSDRGLPVQQRGPRQDCAEAVRRGEAGVLADTTELGHKWDRRTRGRRSGFENGSELGNAISAGSQGRERSGDLGLHGAARSDGPTAAASLLGGFWRDAEWLYCRDEKYRPVESGTFPLASGATNRVGRLRGYGNAINAEVAKEFIAAYMEIERA